MDRHAHGLALLFLSAAAYSTAGFFTRLIPLDAWTILFWRGLFAGLFLATVVVWQERRNAWRSVRAIGVPGLIAAACSTLATICFLNGFRMTSVADVVVILAAGPFVTAAFGWAWLGLRESRATLIASAAALVGVVAMMHDAIGSGHWLGDVFAFAVTALMAVVMLIMRRHADTPMLPAASLSALLCPLLVWPVAVPAEVSAVQLGQLVLFGTTQFGLGLLFLSVGQRLVSATEGALVYTLETPLAILWVWLAFSETASVATLAGGGIVLAAVAGHALYGTRRSPDDEAVDPQSAPILAD